MTIISVLQEKNLKPRDKVEPRFRGIELHWGWGGGGCCMPKPLAMMFHGQGTTRMLCVFRGKKPMTRWMANSSRRAICGLGMNHSLSAGGAKERSREDRKLDFKK